jgi:hypothetical protein
MRIVGRWGLAIALFLAFASSAVSGGYDLLEIEGKVVKWGETRFGAGATVSYAFADRTLSFPGARNCPVIEPARLQDEVGAIGSATMASLFEQALSAWENVADLAFVKAASVESADIVIGAQTEPRGRAYANVTAEQAPMVERAINNHPASVAAAPQPRTGASENIGRISRALICLNPHHLWKTQFDGDMNIYDLRYTFMHEIGHAIGLNHSGRSGSVMAFGYDEKTEVLESGDIAGAVRLYGPPRSFAQK